MIRLPSRTRIVQLLPRRTKIQIILSILSGLTIILLLTLGNLYIRFSILISIILVSIRFNPFRFFPASLHLLALVKVRLLGYQGSSKDLAYLISRSPDAIDYLLRDFSNSDNGIDYFYKFNGISKIKICFGKTNNSPNWNYKSAHKVAGLARYLVLSQISNENVIAGLNLYGCLLKHSKRKVFQARLVEPHFQHQKVLLDGLMSVGAFEEWRSAHKMLAREIKNFQSARCDAENPFISTGIDTSEDRWLKQFNEYFNSFGLQEIELHTSGNSPFDRLNTRKLDKVKGPLVTIIVSAYNPGPELITAVQSLLNQTWESIEIIIVDDFSTQTDYLDKARAMDPRVKLLRQAANLGTYAARNFGIRNSNGAFLTTHDSDDWAHPQRIEFQVKSLLAREKNLANLSWCIRVSSDLRVSTLGYSETRVNASSLMFRRELVESIGYFDELKKGADSEFRMRIAAQFPGSVSIIGFQPLSIIRIGHQSLSRSDFNPLWVHPNRHFYKQSYETWHKTANFTNFTIPLSAKSYRLPFPSPIAFLNDSDTSALRNFDVVVAANFSSEFVTENIGLKNIKQFIEDGLQVGALNLASLNLSEPFDQEFQKLVSAQKIQWVSQDNIAKVKKLVVIDPEFLLLRSFLPQLLDVQEIEIHVTELEALVRRFQAISGIRINLNDYHELKNLICNIHENAFTLFQESPSWFFEKESDFDLVDSLGAATIVFKFKNT